MLSEQEITVLRGDLITLVPRDEERVTTMCASPIIFPPKSSQVFRLETKFLLLSTCSLWATVANTPEQCAYFRSHFGSSPPKGG